MGGDGDEECVELTASGGEYEGDNAKLQDKSVGGQWRDKYYAWRNERYKLPRHYRLVSGCMMFDVASSSCMSPHNARRVISAHGGERSQVLPMVRQLHDHMLGRQHEGSS